MLDEGPCIGHINLARGYRGGERQTELLLRGLSSAGWRQMLVARRGEPLACRCRDIRELDVVQAGGNVLGAARALRRAAWVHAHDGRSVQAAWLNRRLTGIPYLVTRRIQKGPRRTMLNRVMYRDARSIVVLSTAIGRSLSALDGSLRFSVIPSASSDLPADPDRARAMRQEFGAGFVVGHVGALVTAHKGQDRIIEMARRLRDMTFVLVGDGQDRDNLKQSARGLRNVRFVGQTSDVGSCLAAFDAFVFPSRHEGLGSILLDALQFGLPVVASEVGGIPDVIEAPHNGFLCAPDDIDAFCAAVRRLHDDPSLREEIARNNRRKAERFSATQMVSRYIGLYQEYFRQAES